MSMPPEDDETVGYGRPPKASRFKPGQSGNPRGRPKGRTSFLAGLSNALNAPVTVTVQGRRKTLRMGEVITKQWVNDAAKGNAKARGQLLPFINQLDAEPPTTSVDAQEADILAVLRQRLKASDDTGDPA